MKIGKGISFAENENFLPSQGVYGIQRNN
jgi:hypothetical protein